MMNGTTTPHENMTNLSKKMSYSTAKKKKKYPGSATEMQYKEKDGMKYGTGTGRKTSNRGVLY